MIKRHKTSEAIKKYWAQVHAGTIPFPKISEGQKERWRKIYSGEIPKPSINRGRTNFQRFQEGYMVIDSGCWEWQKSLKGGYAQFWINGKNDYAHRFSYEFFKAPIPPDKEIDHLCKNKKCVNPAHLDLVTRKENIYRSNGLAVKNFLKTHCPHGHPYGGSNIYIVQKTGERQCRFCKNYLKKIRRFPFFASHPALFAHIQEVA